MHRRPSRAVVGSRLRWLLRALLAGFALLVVNSIYLAGVTAAEWWTGAPFQGAFYQSMFLFHLLVGLAFVLPALAFLLLHGRRAVGRPNRAAVRAGLGLAGAVLMLLASGLLLVRFDFFAVNDPALRSAAYWTHVLVPLAIAWLFVLHRLAGPPLRWRGGVALGAVAVVAGALIVVQQAGAPRAGGAPGPATGAADFRPALVRTADGGTIDSDLLMMDGYCQQCHAEVHDQWRHSAHRFSSFNNPVYRFSVLNTRAALEARDGDGSGARNCAGCHDLVPLLSGRFDEPGFDLDSGPEASAGLTCTACHAITHVNSPRGNADFTIAAPEHYPFTFSENPVLQWLNGQLIKAKPDFHRQTFLKPLHQSPEFCGSCHKVHLPEALNDYKWLRGQNHYDSFLLSGVSGHGVGSFYYPEQAEPNCNDCHMAPVASAEFGADWHAELGGLGIRGHQFPAANTGLAHLLGLPEEVVAAHRDMLEGSVRVDLVALRTEGRIDGEMIGPLRPGVPALEPGREYLLQLVLRTLTLGHLLTQGTADSNQLWVEVEVRHEGRTIARSGGLEPAEGRVDPWSHFVNAWMLDRDGNRIALRNAEDIFVPLYNHQIPPGAADVVHYRLAVPASLEGELTIRATLHYRKFDTELLRHVQGENFRRNDLPIVALGSDTVTFPLGPAGRSRTTPAPDTPKWMRLNDYGIGALRKPGRRQLRQAEELFRRVETLGRGEGSLNLARVYLAEGRLDEAAAALGRAQQGTHPAPPWSVAWFSGQLLFQQGRFAAALDALLPLFETRFAEARARGFDFSRDYRLTNQIGLTWVELARRQEGGADRQEALREARRWFDRSLAQDPENVEAHYNLGRLLAELGDTEAAAFHRAEHERYRLDDNARDLAVASARRANPAADHAADPVVIYDLHRRGAEAYGPVRSVPAARDRAVAVEGR